MTGRRHRWVLSRIGVMEYVPRRRDGASADSINIAERQAFQEGRKLVAIISQVDNTRESTGLGHFAPGLKGGSHFAGFCTHLLRRVNAHTCCVVNLRTLAASN